MQYLAALLGSGSRIPDNVDDRHVLAESATDAAESAELSGPEGSHERARALVPSITISGIGSDQLVRRTDPVETFGFNQIKQSKLKVYERIRLFLYGIR